MNRPSFLYHQPHMAALLPPWPSSCGPSHHWDSLLGFAWLNPNLVKCLTLCDEHRPPVGPRYCHSPRPCVLLLFSKGTPAHPSPVPDLRPNTHPSALVGAFESHFTEKIEETRSEVCHPPVSRPPAPTGTAASVPNSNSPPSLLSQRTMCLHSHRRLALLLGPWLPFLPAAQHHSPPNGHFSPLSPTAPHDPLAAPHSRALSAAYGYALSSRLTRYPSSRAVSN